MVGEIRWGKGKGKKGKRGRRNRIIAWVDYLLNGCFAMWKKRQIRKEKRVGES